MSTIADTFTSNDRLASNLFGSFTALQSMDLVFRIEAALIWADQNNMIVISLNKACKDKKPANVIIKTCRDMIADNYSAMAFILKAELCDRIKNFKV